MPEFTVSAVLEVPLHPKLALLDKPTRKAFLKTYQESLGACGCYIFAAPRKRASGMLPIYVGKATKSFSQECFTDEKLNKISRHLLQNNARALSLILIKHPKQQGLTNARAIADMERFLIQMAVAANPGLVNKWGTKPADWSIKGVIRSGPGKPSARALLVRSLLGLNGK